MIIAFHRAYVLVRLATCTVPCLAAARLFYHSARLAIYLAIGCFYLYYMY